MFRLMCFVHVQHISFLWHRAPHYDPAAQQQSSPLAAAARNSLRMWLLLQ